MVLVVLLEKEQPFSGKKKRMDALLLAFSFLFLLSFRPDTEKRIWHFAVKVLTLKKKEKKTSL